jgi:hypothetical protein
MVRDAKGVCPVCNRIFLTFRRPEDPEHVIQPTNRPRTTCGRIECMDAETARFLRPEMERIWARIDEAQRRERQKAEAKQQKQLRKLGELL